MASLWSSLGNEALQPQQKMLLEAVQASLGFELHLEKLYKWTSSSLEEEKTFLRCLWKLNQRFLGGTVTFVNIPSGAVEGMQRPQEDRKEAELREELSVYQEMSPKEATDVLQLMEEHEPLVNNSVAFAEQLSRELQALDEANLRAILSSGPQVARLLGSIDEALAEVGRVEQTLQVYEELLGSVRQQMDHIHRESSLLHRVTANRARLMDEILLLTNQLQLSREHRDALSQADLSSPRAIGACVAAAEALSACMDIPIHPSYRKLQAVAEQLILFETLKQNFEKSFINHLSNIFEQQGNSQLPALAHPTGTVAVPSHAPQHEELLPYTALMAWLRSTNPALFWDLPKVYSQNLGRLYEQEIKALFEQARSSLLGRRKGSLQETWEKPMGSRPQPWWSLPGSRGARRETLARGNIPEVLEQVLKELQPLCTSEQQFLQEFFQLGHDSVAPEVKTSATKGGEPTASPEDPPCTRARSQPEEGTAQLLSELFSCLEPELRAFLDVCSKAHPLGCLQVLVAGSLCKEMEEAKAPSRTRGAILPSISSFQDFFAFSEEVFRTSRCRRELDKAQLRLASSVFSSINSLSSANLKVNTDMVMMENFHHIHSFLCQKNIPCLEDKKREAERRCREHMEKYIAAYLGQPLERLNHFFDGVKACLAQGVKEEEVSFQLAYSKQELRKVIEKYPGKEVKRALETLYRKIHKYLSPEENLLPVVWQVMEQQFIWQYREFEELIQRCYAGAGIALDFTMEDLLSYFSSITMSNM